MTLFPDGKAFQHVSLRALAQAYLGKSSERIGLAGFQRSAVWNEARVEDLWDSLLCRFPIGSLLLARCEDFSQVGVRPAQLTRSAHYPDTLVDAGGGYIVVDGQQRLNAVALGYLPYEEGSAARLWIDLAGPRDRTRRQFDFTLCTRENPFGRDLKREEKRIALNLIQEDGADDSELSLERTFPHKARLPVPFVELCLKIQKGLALGSLPTALSGEDLKVSEMVMDHIRSRLQHFDQGFFSQLESAAQRLVFGSEYVVPLILIEKHSEWMDAQMLGRLFQRVNINGVVPPQAELFYSALKLSMPQINNHVAHVYNDPEMGRLLKPTDIVLAALRLLDPNTTSLQLAQFDRLGQDQRHNLLSLLERQGSLNSVIARCVNLAYQALHHNGQPGDIGLARQHLAALRPRVWHTALIWIHANLERLTEQGIGPSDRLNLVRYALLDALNYMCTWQRDSSAFFRNEWFIKEPGLSAARQGEFPGIELFQKIIQYIHENGYTAGLLNLQDFSGWLMGGEAPGQLSHRFLRGGENLLLYAQRYHLRLWEKYRLDIDHILPTAWMSFKAGPIPESRFWKVEGYKSWWRYAVLNWAGNKRYWPDTLNRLYHDIAPAQKFIHADLQTETDEVHRKYGLSTVEDVLQASAIDPATAAQWAELALAPREDQRRWSTGRFLEFAQVVNQRRVYLYRNFYDALGFEEWQEALNPVERLQN